MKLVQSRPPLLRANNAPMDFAQLKKSFLADVVATITMEEIPAELILNWDQTGIKIVPSSTWTMEQKGANRVKVGVNDKCQNTAIFCGTLTGDFLPVQLVYKGKTPCYHPHFGFLSGWHITHSPKYWSTEQTMLQYILITSFCLTFSQPKVYKFLLVNIFVVGPDHKNISQENFLELRYMNNIQERIQEADWARGSYTSPLPFPRLDCRSDCKQGWLIIQSMTPSCIFNFLSCPT